MPYRLAYAFRYASHVSIDFPPPRGEADVEDSNSGCNSNSSSVPLFFCSFVPMFLCEEYNVRFTFVLRSFFQRTSIDFFANSLFSFTFFHSL